MNPDAITRELRALPKRRAPRTLVGRVEAVLAHQAALPWWHRSWPAWPLAVRLGAAGGALTGLTLTSMAFEAAWRGVDVAGLIAARLPWLGSVRHLAEVAAKVGSSLVQAVPAPWLYGLAGAAFLAAAVLATGTTAAIRLLIAPTPEPRRQP